MLAVRVRALADTLTGGDSVSEQRPKRYVIVTVPTGLSSLSSDDHLFRTEVLSTSPVELLE